MCVYIHTINVYVGITCEVEQKEMLLTLCGETASSENLIALRSV